MTTVILENAVGKFTESSSLVKPLVDLDGTYNGTSGSEAVAVPLLTTRVQLQDAKLFALYCSGY